MKTKKIICDACDDTQLFENLPCPACLSVTDKELTLITFTDIKGYCYSTLIPKCIVDVGRYHYNNSDWREETWIEYISMATYNKACPYKSVNSIIDVPALISKAESDGYIIDKESEEIRSI